MASEPPHSLHLLLNHRRSESGYFSNLRSDVVLVASCLILCRHSHRLGDSKHPWYQNAATTGVLQLAELNLRTRVVELLRLGAEGGCLTFDDAFNKAFIEKQSLFHCALSLRHESTMLQKLHCNIKFRKRAADSRTSDRQARRKTDSQSAEPRPRPQYFKYTPDGTIICPDYNTRGCSPNKCWYKSLIAVHCCDVWGCYKEHPRWDH